MNYRLAVIIILAVTLGLGTLFAMFYFNIDYSSQNTPVSAFQEYYVTFERDIEPNSAGDNSEEIINSNREKAYSIFDNINAIHYSINTEFNTIPSFTVRMDQKAFNEVKDHPDVISISLSSP